jgi:hypothetical protein
MMLILMIIGAIFILSIYNATKEKINYDYVFEVLVVLIIICFVMRWVGLMVFGYGN